MRGLRLYLLLMLLAAIVFGSSAGQSHAKLPNSCGNGQLWNMEIGMIGQVNPDPPLPNNLRMSPGGEVLEQLAAGEIFYVVGGPECTDDGLSWWQVKPWPSPNHPAYWTAQGEGDDYYLIPFDFGQVAEDNFQTWTELGCGDPAPSSRDQLAFAGGQGGRAEVHPFYRYMETFSVENAHTQVLLVRPDGNAVIDVEHSGPINASWWFLPDQPAGEWYYRYFDTDNRLVEGTTWLIPQYSPYMAAYCDPDFILVLAGFMPHEQVYMRMIQFLGNNGDVYDQLMRWELQVDWQGQLVLTFTPDVPRAIEPPYRMFQVITSYGKLVGTTMGVTFHSSPDAIRFTCDNYDYPNNPDITLF